MKITATLAEWREAMLGSCETRRMLRRIEADSCLPASVETLFFNAISTEVVASPLPASQPFRTRAIWAGERLLTALGNVIRDVSVRGPEVAGGVFDNLARIRPARDYRWCLPTAARQQFFLDFGIGRDDWPTAPDDQLRLWIEAHQVDYTGPIETGGRSGPAFVTDYAQLPVPTPSFEDLQNLLGLIFADGSRTLGILCRYRRTELTSQGLRLCLPRSVDGLDYPPFEMEPDCTAPHGRTRQLNGSPGLPEAIHASCQIPGRPVSSLEVIP